MNSNPLFKTDKDRNDFFIALLVLLFFGWLMYWLGFRNTGVNDLTKEATALVTTDAVDEYAYLNRDDDTESIIVKDRQIIEDDAPVVREEMAVVKKSVDTDGDGVADKRDKCPTVAGPLVNNGCPLASEMDSDKDGIMDDKDKCPNLIGTARNGGCPPDTDKDGVYDTEDKCPRYPGNVNNGGCPPDTDKDGLHDKIDKCPNKPGKANLGGCPEVVVDDAERKVITEEIQGLEFETGKAILKGRSASILDKVVQIMKKYPDYKLDIIGHTDNVGQAANNLALSQQRAKACYDYLVSKGINNRRLASKGFGQTRPIEANDTPAGRQKNRRVEFDLHY